MLTARVDNIIIIGLTPNDITGMLQPKMVQHIKGEDVGTGYDIIVMLDADHENIAKRIERQFGVSVPRTPSGTLEDTVPETPLEYYRVLEKELAEVTLAGNQTERENEIRTLMNKLWFKFSADELSRFISEEERKTNGRTAS
jgi:hypothetical protein